MIMARMRASGAWSDACILNVSRKGMLLRSTVAPSWGSYLQVRRGEHTFVRRVDLGQTDRFGVQTQDYVPVDRLSQKPDRSTPLDAVPAGCAERRSPKGSIAVVHENNLALGGAMGFETFVTIGALANMFVAGVAVESVFEPLAQADEALASR